jgi:hypothetical protein
MEKPTTSRSDPATMRAYQRWYYIENKYHYLQRTKAYRAKAVAAKRKFVSSYLAAHPCLDCGEPDPIVLEFDHRPGTIKRFNVSEGINSRYSMQTMLAEIAKCDIRCANCHRRITHMRRKLAPVDRIERTPFGSTTRRSPIELQPA